MTKKIKIALYSLVAFMISFCLQAQEQLMPLNANGSLISYTTSAKTTQASRTTSVTALLNLPFFEDFSYSTTSPYPSPNYWLDSNVFINHTYPIAAPSIGVATFDGLNKKGYPYNLSALVSSSAQADKLTSRPINLELAGTYTFQPSDSIYLSFYYQAEGRGDNPETNDSLSVDFYMAKQKKWKKVWGAKGYNPGSADTLFRLVMLPVKDTAYLDSMFQFRFRNKATLSGSLDHWHVDYIRMDKIRSYADTAMLEDIAFQYMSTSFLKNYSVMPYRQYIPTEMAPSIQNYIRNNFSSGKNTTYDYTVYDINGVVTNTYTGSSENIAAYKTGGLHNKLPHSNPPVSFAFPALTDFSLYTIKHYIFSNPDLRMENDTIFQTQRFSDYYAYDDGTAEVGYYNNTYGAMNAVRFTLNKPDTLRALRIYFDPITDGHNIINSTFNIMVWNDGLSGPGSLIYSDSTNNESYPKYIQGKYNVMPTYNLSECLILNPGTYYFGIKQKTNRPLNIGFDKNNDHSNAFYYNIGGSWVQSAIKGSIMINPLMGCFAAAFPVGVKDQSETESHVTIYPNPAQNTISIDTDAELKNATVTILSSIGQVVYSAPYTTLDTIDVQQLPNGMYVVQVSNPSSGAVVTRKLIISR